MGKGLNMALSTAMVVGLAGCEIHDNRSSRKEETPRQGFSPYRTPADQLSKPQFKFATSEVERIQRDAIYVVTLETRKKTIDLDDPIGTWFENEMKAEEHNVVVGQSTFDSWRVGEELASKRDVVGFLVNSDWSRYVTKVVGKDKRYVYFVKNANDEAVEITEREYVTIMQKLESEKGDRLVKTNAGDIENVYVMDTRPEDIEITDDQPLTRCFVVAEIQNSSVTLSLVKHMRNVITAVELTLEVPCSNQGQTNLWKEGYNAGSFLLAGRLSQLGARVKDRWEKEDPSTRHLKDAKGKSYIVPKAMVSRFRRTSKQP